MCEKLDLCFPHGAARTVYAGQERIGVGNSRGRDDPSKCMQPETCVAALHEGDSALLKRHIFYSKIVVLLVLLHKI